jgi:outer membrane protein
MAFAEQITTVAVFDMDRIFQGFFTDSDVLRDYHLAQNEFRDDLANAEADLQQLRAQRANALNRNDTRLASRLRDDIADQQQYIVALEARWQLTEDELLARLQDDVFYTNLYDVVEYVAEENGYTLVLDIASTGLDIFWYSLSIDVTEEIIQELLRQYR